MECGVYISLMIREEEEELVELRIKRQVEPNRCVMYTFVPGRKTTQTKRLRLQTAMEPRDLKQEFEDQFNDVVSRLHSKQLFQSDWDIASFAVFFIFIGMILLLVILVLIRCCCCCCDDEKPRRRKVGIENMALEP
ncbi:small integral membrane protein 22 [Dicentrarchus labrax]|nr:small integral membrane protein 22 [Dicentrarchus labrax]